MTFAANISPRAGFLACLALQLLALGLMIPFMRSDYVVETTNSGETTGSYTSVEVMSLFVSILTGFGTFTALIDYGKRVERARYRLDGIILVAASLISLVGAFWGYQRWRGNELLDCGILWCVTEENGKSSGAMLTVGLVYVLGSLALGGRFFCAGAVVIAESYRKGEDSDRPYSIVISRGEAATVTTTRTTTTTIQEYNINALFDDSDLHRPLTSSARTTTTAPTPNLLRLLFITMLYLSILFVLTTLLPNVWGKFTPPGIASNLALIITNTEYAGSEYTYAFMSTLNVYVKEGVVAKIFPDSLIFYVGLLLSAVAGVVLRRRVKAKAAALACILLGMTVLMSVYWFHDHLWEGYVHDIPTAETVGRGMGQMAVYLMALLLFPVSRNSIFNGVLNVSWESTLYVHVALGYLFMICVVAHVVSWLVLWSDLGLGFHDIYSLKWYYPDNGQGKEGGPQSNNFTNPLILMATYLFMVSMFFNWFRRKFFDVFYVLHQVTFAALTVATFWHAASAWYYLAPGLLLWITDRLLRVSDGRSWRAKIKDARVVDVGGGEWITWLKVRVGDEEEEEEAASSSSCPIRTCGDMFRFCFRKSRAAHKSSPAFKFTAGQYAFLHIPSISAIAHPFTISSAPPANNIIDIEFCVKAVGDPNQFTQKIKEVGQRLEASIEGPYGHSAALEPTIHERLVLLSGGIGVTPCISILRDILLELDGQEVGHYSFLKKIDFIWVVRDEKMLELFSEVFEKSLKYHPILSVSCYITRTRIKNFDDVEGNQGWRAAQVKDGRPNLLQVLLDDEGISDISKTQVFACGPTSLVNSGRDAARSVGCNFHSEAFEF